MIGHTATTRRHFPVFNSSTYFFKKSLRATCVSECALECGRSKPSQNRTRIIANETLVVKLTDLRDLPSVDRLLGIFTDAQSPGTHARSLPQSSFDRRILGFSSGKIIFNFFFPSPSCGLLKNSRRLCAPSSKRIKYVCCVFQNGSSTKLPRYLAKCNAKSVIRSSNTSMVTIKMNKISQQCYSKKYIT